MQYKYKILDNKARGFLLQVVVVVLVVSFFYNISSNVVDNINARGINVGFHFLSDEAGFDISDKLIAYDQVDTNARALLVGVLNTLYVSVIGIVIASILGLIIGIARLSNNWLVRKLSSGYIELFRNIPILLQILFWYNIILSVFPPVRQSAVFFDNIFINLRGVYFPKISFSSEFLIFLSVIAIIVIVLFLFKKRYRDSGEKNISKVINWLFLSLLVVFVVGCYFISITNNIDYPVFRGFNFKGGASFSPELIALTFALSIYTATYIAEAVRSGIESVFKGQKEAALALGLSKKQTLKHVILPQALRVSVPPIINQYLNLTKNSSLAVAIGYPDLVNVFTGTTLNVVGQALEIIGITMGIYLMISLTISAILNIVNKKLEIKEK